MGSTGHFSVRKLLTPLSGAEITFCAGLHSSAIRPFTPFPLFGSRLCLGLPLTVTTLKVVNDACM